MAHTREREDVDLTISVNTQLKEVNQYSSLASLITTSINSHYRVRKQSPISKTDVEFVLFRPLGAFESTVNQDEKWKAMTGLFAAQRGNPLFTPPIKASETYGNPRR
jgi:hypothetical protein